MRAIVVQEIYRVPVPLEEIYRGNRAVSFYRVLNANNMFVALMNEQGFPARGITDLEVRNKKKVPVYKQAMDMQMGRIPKSTTVSSKTYHLQEITPIKALYHLYAVRVGY